MKATVQSLVFVLMVGGILAAGMYPTHSVSASTTPIMILGEGTAPAPLCQPGDKTCNPGPLFPYIRESAEGTAPAPLCQPGDKTCKPGPLFPYLKDAAPALMAEGTAPAPLCQPGDKTCNPGPLFPY